MYDKQKAGAAAAGEETGRVLNGEDRPPAAKKHRGGRRPPASEGPNYSTIFVPLRRCRGEEEWIEEEMKKEKRTLLAEQRRETGIQCTLLLQYSSTPYCQHLFQHPLKDNQCCFSPDKDTSTLWLFTCLTPRWLQPPTPGYQVDDDNMKNPQPNRQEEPPFAPIRPKPVRTRHPFDRTTH